MPEPQSPHDAALARFLLKILFAGGASALAPIVTRPAAAVLGSAAGQLVDRVSRDWGERAARNADRLIEIAAADADADVETFGGLVMADQGVRQLAAKVIPLAGDATTEQQLRLYGRILANAAVHPERVEEESLIASAIANLEPPHFRLLAILNEQPHQGDEPTRAPIANWSGALVRARLGWQPEVVSGVLLALQAAGLVYVSATMIDGGDGSVTFRPRVGKDADLGELTCEVTAFGGLVTERALAAHAAAASE